MKQQAKINLLFNLLKRGVENGEDVNNGDEFVDLFYQAINSLSSEEKSEVIWAMYSHILNESQDVYYLLGDLYDSDIINIDLANEEDCEDDFDDYEE